MKFMLIVHHNEEAFQNIEKEKRQQMLAESIELTHQLHANGQYINASPLQPGGNGSDGPGARRQAAPDGRSLHRNP